jgi:hypothetical protein
MARHTAATPRKRPSRPVVIASVVVVIVLAAAGIFIGLETSSPARGAHGLGATSSRHGPTSTSSSPVTAQTSAPPSSSTTTSTTLSVPGTAGPGFVAGHVTAIGDSVMLDYQDPLQAAIPGVNINAAVSRQWSDGETILQSMKASGQLGADVIVALGTNGPITDSDFDTMMSILGGASRVVFVNVHVDRPWQDPNNAVLASGAQRYPNVVIADWASLASENPQWFGADGTHLAIDGPGADALALLVATTLANG